MQLCPLIWVRFRPPGANSTDSKVRNAPKPDRKWPPAEGDAC